MSTEVLALRWGSVVAAGAAMILVGVLSVAFADAAGQALIAFLGWLLLLGGVMTLLVALLRVATGVLFIAAPRAWASAIVTLVGLYFLVDGAFRVLLAFQARPAPGWGYVLTGGSAALLLGLLMVLELSGDGAFVVGLLFGIHLLFDGWATLMLAAAARAARR
jgi:uncharacterized membrane protein HdeD (DUF308 family)